MGFVTFVESYVVGSSQDISTWWYTDWIVVGWKAAIIGAYLGIHTLLTMTRLVLQTIILTPLFLRCYSIYRRFWWHVPFFGPILLEAGSYCLTSIPRVINPTLSLICEIIEIIFQIHVTELMFGHEKESVRIVYGEDCAEVDLFDEENQLMTTLVLSNHRSLVDYLLIQHLLMKGAKEHTTLRKKDVIYNYFKQRILKGMQVQFLSWGQIVKFPTLLFGFNVLNSDENCFVPSDDLETFLKSTTNQCMVHFPETNILTTELFLVQRSINSSKTFAVKYNNLLNPRFKTFVNVIDCFAKCTEIPRLPHIPIVTETKKFINKKLDDIITNSNGDVQQNAVVTHIIAHSDVKSNQESKPHKTKKQHRVRINSHIYDITIVYLRVKYVTNVHDHIDGSIVPRSGYQLDEIAPSLLELLRPDSKVDRDPIITYVNIKRFDTDAILCLKDRHLEKWLEDIWKQKDLEISKVIEKITVN
ncbi:hypothetical protein B1J92_A03806g [Nakaseomyces glabratus]|nr:hypothetical protein B1J91_A03806g [Nakaseomyces glabratus]OXB50726.1 hypothetical protein B1J92_A03806g [Nakaseomyces glabratus]